LLRDALCFQTPFAARHPLLLDTLINHEGHEEHERKISRDLSPGAD
jgi:hypothetical protein